MDLCLVCLPHRAYSPDLAAYDYIVFGPLMDVPRGKMFSTEKEIRALSLLTAGPSQKIFFCFWGNPSISDAIADPH